MKEPLEQALDQFYALTPEEQTQFFKDVAYNLLDTLPPIKKKPVIEALKTIKEHL